MIRILLVFIFSITSLAVCAEEVVRYTAYIPKDFEKLSCDSGSFSFGNGGQRFQVSCLCRTHKGFGDLVMVHAVAPEAFVKIRESFVVTYQKTDKNYMYLERSN